MAQSGALKLVALNHIYSIDIWSCAMIPTKYKTPDGVWWFLGHLFSTIAIGFSAMPADRWTCSRQRIGKRTVKTQVHENQIDYIQLYTISSNFSIVMQLDLAIPSNSVQFHPILPSNSIPPFQKSTSMTPPNNRSSRNSRVDLNSRVTVPAACGSAHKPRLGQHISTHPFPLIINTTRNHV